MLCSLRKDLKGINEGDQATAQLLLNKINSAWAASAGGTTVISISVDPLTIELAREIRYSEKIDWEKFTKKAKQIAKPCPVKYGQGLIFITTLFHGSEVNSSETTRISINLRVKGLFSPAGQKNPFDFWQIYKTGVLTNNAIEFEKL